MSELIEEHLDKMRSFLERDDWAHSLGRADIRETREALHAVMSDHARLAELEKMMREAVASAANAMNGAPRDWSTDQRDAWAYGIICGWPGVALTDVALMHDWIGDEVQKLREYRAAIAETTESKA